MDKYLIRRIENKWLMTNIFLIDIQAKININILGNNNKIIIQ